MRIRLESIPADEDPAYWKPDAESLVFDPCGNVPDQGDFLGVMRRNLENLRRAYR